MPATPGPAAQPATQESEGELPVFDSPGAGRRRGASPWKLPTGRALLPIILGAAGLLVLLTGAFVLLLLGMWAGWFSRSNRDDKQQAPRRIVVGTSGLAAALRNAKPGDRIVLEGDLLEDSVHVTTSDLTIEGEEGKTVVWRCPATALPNSKLLHLTSVSGVTIKNITFDGANKADALILLFAKNPGLRLQNLRLQNFVKQGILVANCEGTEDRKIALSSVRFQTEPNRTAIHFTTFPHARAILKDRFFDLRGCEFYGPGKKITADEGDIDPATIDLPSGVAIETLPKPKK
jgi:hypothetical protein